MFAGAPAIWAPLAFLFVTQFWLFHRSDDTHALFDDWLAHLQYFPAFLFGFGLAGSQVAMAGLARFWTVSAALAVASYAAIAGLLIAYPDFNFPTHEVTLVFRFAREVETWTATAALIGIAERFLNHNHRSRQTLAEATFPFYIIHQTIIVVVEFWLRPLELGAAAEFVLLVMATVAGCWAFYLAGREVNGLRPLIGLKRRASERPIRASHVRAEADLC